ncbi:MAG: transporter substrate-binding domain-containing protein [Rhodospirillales bacterium]|nr:transporter substrate-binding domain-containing protein [Rhodospirillales bacterium]
MRTFKIAFVLILFALPSSYSQAAEDEISYTFANWEPAIYLDDSSQAKGMFAELLNEIFVKEMKMKLVFKKRPWARAQRDVEIGNSDFLITVDSQERLKYSMKSATPLFLLYLNVYSYHGHEQLKEIENIKTVEDIIKLKLLVASNLGNGWHKENVEQKGVETTYIPTDESLARFVAAKRTDIMIDAPLTMNHLIKKLGLSSEIVMTPAKFGPLNFYLLVSKKSKHLHRLPEINQAISKLKQEGVLDQIISKYTQLN